LKLAMLFARKVTSAKKTMINYVRNKRPKESLLVRNLMKRSDSIRNSMKMKRQRSLVLNNLTSASTLIKWVLTRIFNQLS
jgi:hypothetical protein